VYLCDVCSTDISGGLPECASVVIAKIKAIAPVIYVVARSIVVKLDSYLSAIPSVA